MGTELRTTLLLLVALVVVALLVLTQRGAPAEPAPEPCVSVAAADGRGLPECGRSA